MKLRQIMTQDVSTVSPKDSILEVAKIMQERNVGCVPVCAPNKEVMGVLTDRDIVLRVVAEGKNPNDLDVSQVMSTDLRVGNTEMHIEDAAQIMAEHQIRRLPVIENKKLVGIVSVGDLATQQRFIEEAGESLSRISQPSRPLM